MKKFLISFFLLLSSGFIYSQEPATISGELLVQLSEKIDPNDIVRSFEEVNGILPQLRAERLISDHMYIWLFSFDEVNNDKKEILRALSTIPGVKVAQANHMLESRVVPNDPFYGQQWHHSQSEDHDIDSDLAWDITTGGATAAGDEIVVCIVELGGSKWDNADIIENHWVNTHEIPSNGIDDDDNGYIDDYDGWNTSTATDNIDPGDHGTRVSSMIGSQGNNNLGVTGVNWNVKMMQVEVGGVSEANAIAGYTYPLKMRKLYNETNGALGAFVVSTNTSWGVNNGQPADAPLWCAMYDSLGYYGVLSCGSTSNSNVNIDAVGDLPTACPSEFMISVGRTNNQDVRASGGYGITTIDIMAPGDNVYLANNSSYATTTGTSFSGPCVAGSIALLYSAPCNSLVQIAYSDPAGAAQMVRDYLLDGVDQTTQLLSETVSGGRLNIKNSLDLLLGECDNGSCIAPFGISADLVNSNLDYLITWQSVSGISAYNIRYSVEGSNAWVEFIDLTSSSFTFEGLLACTTYEVQAQGFCSDGLSDWSNSFVFTTDGCCENPSEFTSSPSLNSSLVIGWNDILATDSYSIMLTPSGGESLLFENITENPYTFSGLLPCTEYSVAIYSICAADALPPNVFTAHTGGCEHCSDLAYCNVSSDASSEYISNVTLGNINRTSGPDGGYILVQDQTTTLNANTTYTITCTPGYSGNSYNENFIAWLDYNSDGDFDEINEKIFDAPTPTMTAISGNFTVPENIPDGSVRLRVAMRYTTANGTSEPSTCGSWTYGEIEDYCVTLDHSIGIENIEMNSSLHIYPNPTEDDLMIAVDQQVRQSLLHVQVYSYDGKLILDQLHGNRQILKLPELKEGIYFINISDDDHNYSSRFIVK